MRARSGKSLAVLGNFRPAPPDAVCPDEAVVWRDEAGAWPDVAVGWPDVAVDWRGAAVDCRGAAVDAAGAEPAEVPPPLRASVACTCCSVMTRGGIEVMMVAVSLSLVWKSESSRACRRFRSSPRACPRRLA